MGGQHALSPRAGRGTAAGDPARCARRPAAQDPQGGADRHLELRCGRSVFKLNGLPSDEFPSLPGINFEEGWNITGKELQRLIHHTAFAVSNEESRPILNGVLWELRDGLMRMVATNGHRLARMAVPTGPATATSADFIIPPAALQQVQRLFKTEEKLYSACISRMSAGHFIQKRTESGSEGVAIMSQAASQRMDEAKKSYNTEGVSRAARGNVYNPSRDEYM